MPDQPQPPQMATMTPQETTDAWTNLQRMLDRQRDSISGDFCGEMKAQEESLVARIEVENHERLHEKAETKNNTMDIIERFEWLEA